MKWRILPPRQSMIYNTIKLCERINLYDLDLVMNYAFSPNLTQTINDVRALRRYGLIKKVNYCFEFVK